MKYNERLRSQSRRIMARAWMNLAQGEIRSAIELLEHAKRLYPVSREHDLMLQSACYPNNARLSAALEKLRLGKYGYRTPAKKLFA